MAEDEKQLLQLTATGDEYAFALIVKRYDPVIYPYLLYWLKDTQLAEEVTQDVFMRIWRHRERLPELENFAGYLYTIARNKANTVLGQQLMKINEPSTDVVDEIINNPQSALELKQLATTLEKAVNLLPPRRREVFVLSRNEGLTYEQIAERLKIARSTVNEHMVAALVFLRYYLREHEGIVISGIMGLLLPFIW
jgi:RNA polymerase sigma-70 factor (ECF subfamily)